MNILKEYIALNSIDKIDVSDGQIQDAEQALAITFDSEYLSYIHLCGQLEYEYLEFYGLGVPLGSHVNVVKAYLELSVENSYPQSALPILDLGDGHYALYNLIDKNVVEWCFDGVVNVLAADLESYIIQTLKDI